MPKYIFVTGGVVSSVGKGTVAASIGKILQSKGYSVDFLKIDPYVNVDAGTLNPYSHGEVFVTDDGGETDLDLGWYERFLDIPMSRLNNLTTGQVFQEVIRRERAGEYLGQCVQIVTHVTDEIKRRIKMVADRRGADIVIVEIGGTVGDIEGQPFYEAARQMKLEEETLFVHVSLVIYLKTTGEFKTKALQHSVNELRRAGIQPDIIVARSERMIDETTKRKIALFGTLPKEAVFCSYDTDVIYEVPLILSEQGLGEYVVEHLSLKGGKPDLSEWRKIVETFKSNGPLVKIAVCGKYTSLTDSYISIKEALKHAAAHENARLEILWVDAEKVERGDLSEFSMLEEADGILVPGGFGKRGSEGKITAINFARTRNKPFLGICFGLQLAVVEFARNVLGLKDANSTEHDPETPHPVIDLMPEQLDVEQKGGTMRLGSLPITVKEGTLAYSLYNSSIVHKRHRHRYEVNPAYHERLNRAGLLFSGMSPDKRRVEIIELPDKKYFIATQYHPEFMSRPGKPEPVFRGLIAAALAEVKIKAMKVKAS
ncbi:MAG: CTP synthase [Nitrososphaerota archaeon]|nr:CTP synthase [Candidatus Calditenuaceae archaeon]MDW8072908.1 CTP synthase [Nitrososphaerota archaeon]